jgi:hypothetical protein
MSHRFAMTIPASKLVITARGFEVLRPTPLHRLALQTIARIVWAIAYATAWHVTEAIAWQWHKAQRWGRNCVINSLFCVKKWVALCKKIGLFCVRKACKKMLYVSFSPIAVA